MECLHVSENCISFKSMFFLDINECANGDHRCDNNAYCENTAQSYTCICRTGYTGNGTVCEGNCQHKVNKICLLISNVFIYCFSLFEISKHFISN